MTYVVITSDGEVHEFEKSAEAVDCLDKFGNEVVDHNVNVDESHGDPLGSLLRLWANEGETEGSPGTCQSCGAYWDLLQRTTCTCGGYIG